MVFGGDRQILHARVLGDLHPLVGVEVDGIEAACELFVYVHGDPSPMLNPLADAGDAFAPPGAGGQGIEAPVDEEAEFGLPPPLHALILGLATDLVLPACHGVLSACVRYCHHCGRSYKRQ